MLRHPSCSRRLVILSAVSVLAACQVQPPVLGGGDQAELTRIETYLEGLQSFQAAFTQSGTDGPAQGYLWVQRPGRLRVEYVRPRPRIMLANHGRLLIADRLSGAVTTMPVSRTPLDIILAPELQFSGPVTVTDLRHFPGTVQISLRKTDAPAEGTLTLQFAEQPLLLTGVVVQDRTGGQNSLILSDLRSGVAIDPARFIYRPDASPSG